MTPGARLSSRCLACARSQPPPNTHTHRRRGYPFMYPWWRYLPGFGLKCLLLRLRFLSGCPPAYRPLPKHSAGERRGQPDSAHRCAQRCAGADGDRRRPGESIVEGRRECQKNIFPFSPIRSSSRLLLYTAAAPATAPAPAYTCCRDCCSEEAKRLHHFSGVHG